MQSIIINNLTKKFGNFTAVDSISFKVKKGELFGFLGPNGAGKTTTIKMLSTLLIPTSGEAIVNGFDVKKDRDNVRKSIGVVFQDTALDTLLTGRENLEFHAMMYDVPKERRKKKIDEVLRLVDLQDKADVVVKKYSGGMKRRLEIARGLIHNPHVLFLDEPTLGLDAQTRRKIWEYIKKLNREEKVTIFLTTHYMEEADFLCDRVAIIDMGKIISMGTPNKLKNTLGGDVLSLEIKQGPEQMKKMLEKCKTCSWIKNIKSHNNHLSLTVDRAETKVPKIIEMAEKSGLKIASVNMRKPSLEDVFIHYTGKTIRDGEPESMRFGPMMRRRA
jgi:ABC-2 type transport system ATP-binding protein